MFEILVAERGSDGHLKYSTTVELARVPVVGDRFFDADNNGYEVVAVFLVDGGNPAAMVSTKKVHGAGGGYDFGGGVEIPPDLWGKRFGSGR